jgi:uncharacterized protein (DUF2062 family)
MSHDLIPARPSSTESEPLDQLGGPPSFWQRKIVAPLKVALKQGVTPHKLALALALGWATGMFPMIGVTLLLCIGLAAVFRLNQLAAQITNWTAYPFLFLLFVPHMRIGEFILRAPQTSLTHHQIREAASHGFRYFLATCGSAIMHAIVGWLVLMPLMFLGAYVALLPLCRRMALNFKTRSSGMPRELGKNA